MHRLGLGYAFGLAAAGLALVHCGGSDAGSDATPAGDGGSLDATTLGGDASHGADAASGGGDDAGTPVDLDAGINADASDAALDGAASDAGADAGGDAGDAGPRCGGTTGWGLVWSDEFDASDGSPVDPTRWSAQTGGTGWGNRERDYTTADLANAHQSGGDLVVTATTAGASAYSCWYGQCQYTSARLQTLGLFAQAYGRFEARIQVAGGQGLWSAFEMLGANVDTVSWPTCGEIDVMENVGKQPGTIDGWLEGPDYSGGSALSATSTLAGGAAYSAAFHVFAVEWQPAAVRFYVDDTLYQTRTPADVPAGGTWEFDHPFYLLLRLAVGGDLPGNPDGTTIFPQSMLVDYVRVCAP